MDESSGDDDKLIEETLESFLSQFEPLDESGEAVLDLFFEMLLSGNRDGTTGKA